MLAPAEEDDEEPEAAAADEADIAFVFPPTCVTWVIFEVWWGRTVVLW